jgi:hypothetical protein
MLSRKGMPSAWWMAGPACALALSVAEPAQAYERQQHAGVNLGGALMTTNGGGTPFGYNLGLHYTYGLWDAVNLVIEADVTGFPLGTPPAKSPPPEPGFVATGGAGLMYVFDVLRWVPYAGGIIGPAYFGGGFLRGGFVTPDLQLGAGLDYELTRSWTVGVAYRQHMFFAKMSDYPEFTTLGLRVEYVWGW